jgi:acyl carrier protein
MKNSLGDRLIEILATSSGLPASGIGPTADIERDLGLNSLDRVVLRAEVEANFQIQIEDSEFARLRTVQEIVSAIEGKLGGGAIG